MYLTVEGLHRTQRPNPTATQPLPHERVNRETDLMSHSTLPTHTQTPHTHKHTHTQMHRHTHTHTDTTHTWHGRPLWLYHQPLLLCVSSALQFHLSSVQSSLPPPPPPPSPLFLFHHSLHHGCPDLNSPKETHAGGGVEHS